MLARRIYPLLVALVSWTCLFALLSGLPQCPATYGQDSSTYGQDSSTDGRDSPNRQWEVGYILVQEEDHGKQIPTDYWPIEISELENRLELIGNQRVQQQLNPGRLIEATYVAFLQRDGLVSDQSRWVFACDESTKRILINRLSCALTDARSLAEDRLQLSADMRYAGDGTIELIPNGTQVDRWFGFQNAAINPGAATQISLELPPALLGRLLILADPSLTISSTEAVVQPIENPSDALPADWGEVILPSSAGLERGAMNATSSKAGNQLQWWSVNLSGISKFTLTVESNTQSSASELQHVLTKFDQRFQCEGSLVSITAEGQLSGSSRQPLQFRLDPSLRLSSITISNQSVSWRSIAMLPDANVIEVDHVFDQSAAKFELKAHAALESQAAEGNDVNYQRQISLPRIELVNSFSLQGTTTVAGSDDWRVHRVVSDIDFSPQKSPKKFEEPESVQTTIPNSEVIFPWVGLWTGQPPQGQLLLQAKPAEWNSEGLTRLAIRDSSLSAQVSLQISGRNLRSNFLELPIASNWLIDKAEIVGANDGRFQMRLVEVAPNIRTLVLRWQQSMPVFNLQIELEAHLPITDTFSTLLLEDARLIQTSAGNHSMNYVIDEDGAYSLRFTPRLLQMIRPIQDLPFWQQGLLEESHAIAFSDFSDGRQLFQFDSLAGNYQVIMRTVLDSTSQGSLQSLTHILCQVRSGGIDRIPLRLSGQESEEWRFQLIQQDGTAVDLQIENVRIENATQKINGDLRLPRKMFGIFSIRASTDAQWQAENGDSILELRTPGIPGAVECDALVLLPDRFTFAEGELPLELLPAGSCCLPEEEPAFFELWRNPNSKESLVARVSGLDSHQLKAVSNQSPTEEVLDASNSKDTWIWSESLNHRIDDSGSITHEILLDVQSQKQGLLMARVPKDWQLHFVAVQDRATQEFLWQPGQLQIALEPAQRSSISIRFTSRRAALSWFSRVGLQAPSYDVPILQRKRMLWVSPKSLVALALDDQRTSSIEPTEASGEIPLVSDRWQMDAWWRWLNPNQLRASDKWGWSCYPLDPNTTTQQAPLEVEIKVVDRNALAMILWGGLVLMTTSSWILLRGSFKVWWMLCCILVGINLVVAESWLLAPQLLLLAMILGCLVRLIERIVTKPLEPATRDPRSRPGTAFSTVLIVVALGLGNAHRVQAQSGLSSPRAQQTETYAVYIPSDSNNAPVGEFAYIPKQLRDLLYQNQSEVGQQAAGSILSASYSVKLRQDERDSELIQTCSVDLKLLVTQANSEIIIPIQGSGMTWVGTPLLNGQSRIWGGRNFSIPASGGGVVFRSDSTGVMNVSLQFRPSILDDGDRKYRFSVEVPPVASAKLRVSTSGIIGNLNVNARGIVQRTFLGDTVATLGPVKQLDLRWSINAKPVNQAPAEQTSETWMHADGDQLVAACQLTVERNQALPREVDVFFDAAWQPVGEIWGDAELVSSSNSTQFRGRTVYRLRLKEPTGSGYQLRMLAVPRVPAPSDRVEAPFLSLDRVNTKSTLFWWSADRDAVWVPDAPESRPLNSLAANAWNSVSLAAQRIGYQILGSGAQIRRQPQTSRNMPISEVNTLRLRSDSTALSFVANWEPSGNQPDSLVLVLPREVIAPELEINGVPARYQLESSGRLMHISMSENGIGRLGRLKLDCRLPNMFGPLHSVPRIHISQQPAGLSTYEIYRTVDLDVSILDTDQALAFQPQETASSSMEMLENLEEKLGQLNVSGTLQQESWVPLFLDVKPAVVPPPQSAVMFLGQSSQGWLATVQCRWDAASEAPKFVFFDLPFRVRDSLKAGDVSFKIMPHSDPNRINLCIPVPALAGSDRQIEFAFRLNDDSSSRTIAIPRIHALGYDKELVLGLPRMVAGAPARWLNAGQILDVAWHQQSGVATSEFHDFYSNAAQLTSVSWHPVIEERMTAQAMLSWVEVFSGDSDSLAGMVHHWLEPKRQISQGFSIPDNCQILGVECNGQKAQWVKNDNQFTVTLQPNTMPIRIRIMARWEVGDQGKLQLPMALGEQATASVLATVPANVPWKISGQTAKTVDDFEAAVVTQWANIVSSSLSTLTSLPAAEGTIWSSQWHPEVLGISRARTIPESVTLQDKDNLDANRDSRVTVGELWTEAEMLIETLPDISSVAAGQMPLAGGYEAWQSEGSSVDLQPLRSVTAELQPGTRWRFLGLAILLLVALSPLALAKSLPKLTVPIWVDWLMLAAFSWWVLPWWWPSVALVLVGCWLMILQRLDDRRRARQQLFR